MKAAKISILISLTVIALSCSALIYQRVIPELKDRTLFISKDGLIYQYCEEYCPWYRSCSCAVWHKDVYPLDKEGEKLHTMGFRCSVPKN